jgi:MFS family permease
MGFYGTITGCGAVISPIAGWICEAYTWQAFMWVVFAVSIIGTLVVLALIPNTGKSLGDAEKKSSKMDWGGTLTLAAFIAALFAFLSFGGLYFQRTDAIGITVIILAAVFLVGFILVERKAANPAFPLDLFKFSAFRAAAIGVFLQTAATSIISTYMPTYAQKVMGTTATTSGMVVVVVSIIFMLVGPAAGQFLGRHPKFKLFALIMPISFVAIQLILMNFTQDTPVVLLYITYAVFYGIPGAINVMIWLSIVQTFLPNDKIAYGTSGTQTVLVFGALIGTAVAGNVMNMFNSGGENLKSGLNAVFIFGIICAVIAFINALTLKLDTSGVEIRIAAKKPLFKSK